MVTIRYIAQHTVRNASKLAWLRAVCLSGVSVARHWAISALDLPIFPATQGGMRLFTGIFGTAIFGGSALDNGGLSAGNGGLAVSARAGCWSHGGRPVIARRFG